MFVLDASALLCLLRGEAGGTRVADALPLSIVSAVNLSEVTAKLTELGGTPDQVARTLWPLHLKVEPFDEDQAQTAGFMRSTTKAFGLSLGDRACLALAKHRSATALTTDSIWADLPHEVGVPIILLR